MRNLSQRPYEDHEELEVFIKSGKIKAQIPSVLDSSHKSKLEKLLGLNGAEFDEQFLSDATQSTGRMPGSSVRGDGRSRVRTDLSGLPC